MSQQALYPKDGRSAASSNVWLPNHPQQPCPKTRRFEGGAAIRGIPDSYPHLVSGADRQACRAVITVQPGGG